jgi:hypothetical protein
MTKTIKQEFITRNKAIEIGAVIDLMEPETKDMVLKMDFPFPLAITYPAFCETIYCSNEKQSASNGFSPGLFAVLQALRLAIRLGNPRKRTYFEVPNPKPGQLAAKFKSVWESDDDGSPMLTITTLGEGDTLNPKGTVTSGVNQRNTATNRLGAHSRKHRSKLGNRH